MYLHKPTTLFAHTFDHASDFVDLPCDVYWVCASECFILYNWYDLQFEIWSRFYWGNVRCEVEGLLSWSFGFPAGGCHFGEFTGCLVRQRLAVGANSATHTVAIAELRLLRLRVIADGPWPRR